MMNIKNCGEGNSGRLLCSDSLLTWKRRSLSSMHKDTKWAKQIIAMQEEDGKWGSFHTLSVSSGRPITTEQALRRLERLGYTIEDVCIQKAVSYMNSCLVGRAEIPDRREKLLDWDIFVSLMLATWIRRFSDEFPAANKVADQWAAVITSAFQGDAYHHKEYISAYHDIFGVKPRGGRFVDFTCFYPISLLGNRLDRRIEEALMDYVLNKEDGIYYIYSEKISSFPRVFESRQASRYLAAIELLAKYRHAAYKLHFVVDWLNGLKKENGKWDMGKSVNDKVYFPLSDDWRKQGTHEADCTERISNLISMLSSIQ